MKAIISFLKTTVLGGVVVVLPTVIMVFVVKWVFSFVSNLIAPVAKLLPSASAGGVVLADIIVIVLIVSGCFVIGVLVKTSVGAWIHRTLEEKLLGKIPGYSLIRETVLQFMGNKKSPFSSVALCQIFGNDTMATGFVTDTHPDGRCTVFIPTGPNPTSGNIYHLKPQYVHPIDIGVEDAMRSIISCGAGSDNLVSLASAAHESS